MNQVLLTVLTMLVALVPLTTVADTSYKAIDQIQADVSGSFTLAIGGTSNQRLAQTVTVGVDGRLHEVLLPIGCLDGELIIDITTVDDLSGEPGTTVLASNRYRADTIPSVVGSAFIAFRIRPRMSFVGGDLYGDGEGFYDALPNQPGWVALFNGVEDLSFMTCVLVP